MLCVKFITIVGNVKQMILSVFFINKNFFLYFIFILFLSFINNKVTIMMKSNFLFIL